MRSQSLAGVASTHKSLFLRRLIPPTHLPSSPSPVLNSYVYDHNTYLYDKGLGQEGHQNAYWTQALLAMLQSTPREGEALAIHLTQRYSAQSND